MQRSIGAILVCLALGGCCTNGTACMTAPTSGSEMAWDGAGQSPNEDFAPVKRPRRPRNEIIVGPLQGTAQGTAQGNAQGNAQGTEPDHAARAGAAVEQPDEAAVAEAQLKEKLVICRGCLSKPSAAQTDAVSPDHQATASASR